MVAGRELKYIYSAADRKEWLFDLRIDPQETKNWAGNPRYDGLLRDMRQALIGRFEGDNYESAIQNGAWREYEPPVFPDPAGDDGLLFQDAPNLPELLKALGPYYEP